MACDEDLFKKLDEYQKSAIKLIMEVQEMKETIDRETGRAIDEADSVRMIPLGAYEMLQERHSNEKARMNESFTAEKTEMRENFQKEKEDIRKSYRKIVTWLASILILVIISIFGTAIWFAHNYEVSGFSQDGDGINNYIGDYAKQGDMNNYGAENPDWQTEEP